MVAGQTSRGVLHPACDQPQQFQLVLWPEVGHAAGPVVVQVLPVASQCSARTETACW